VDPGPLGRRAEPGLGKVCEGVPANLIAGVAPSEAAIVDAAACGSGTCIPAWSSTIVVEVVVRVVVSEAVALIARRRYQLSTKAGVWNCRAHHPDEEAVPVASLDLEP
jgi:hypothetical protein